MSIECDCNVTGTTTSTNQEYIEGYCSCKDGVGGERCNQCLNGYYNFSTDGCTGISYSTMVHYYISLFVLQLVIVMLTTLLVYYVTMVSACVHWALLDHSAMNATMVGIILPAVAVSHATAHSWEVNQMFVINLPVHVTALMEPLVTSVMPALMVPS